MDVSDDMQRQAKALADPSRFRLFRHIVESDGPVGVAELTELLGFNHNAIRQHLTVLRDAELVAETTEQRKVRGRPRKQYQARDDALSAFRSISGSYEQLSRLLLQIVTSGDDPYDVGRAAVAPTATARRTSPDKSSPLEPLVRQLAVAGFEPAIEDHRTVVLQHCPFADVAAIDQEIVCQLHRGLIDGGLDGYEQDLAVTLEPLDPHGAGCRVTLNSTPTAREGSASS